MIEKECPECQGYGWLQSKEWDDYSDQICALAEQYIAQGMDRSEAEKRARTEIEPPYEPKEVPCWLCNGEGTILL